MILVDGLAPWTTAACRNQFGMVYTVADADAEVRVVPVADLPDCWSAGQVVCGRARCTQLDVVIILVDGLAPWTAAACAASLGWCTLWGR